ncbi:Y-e3 family protein [Megaselia abdita]
MKQLNQIDQCNRLWVVDAGTINKTQHCPPKILVYNLEKDTLLFSYIIPEDQYVSGKSQLNKPVVDIMKGQCNKTKVYVADVKVPGLLVFDQATEKSWRIEDKSMNPDLEFETFTIADESINLIDGIYGMSLTPNSFRGERSLYFHVLTSDEKRSVPLKAINNASMWMNNEKHPDVFKLIGNRGVQCGDEAMDSFGINYCGFMDPLSIFAWNINTPYRRGYVMELVNDPERLQFASGMKVIRNKQGRQELRVSSNRLQRIYSKTIDYDEVNFRIMSMKIN